MGECILAGHPQGGKIGYGTYTGDGQAERTISLGVTPKWVLVFGGSGETHVIQSTEFRYYGGLALAGYPCKATTVSSIVEIVDGGFKVFYNQSSKIFSNNWMSLPFRYLYGT